MSQSGGLLSIKQHLGNLIDKWNPDEMAVERIIYFQSHQTAITMWAAKAAVVIAAAEAGLRIMEYSPKSVKLSVVGRGACLLYTSGSLKHGGVMSKPVNCCQTKTNKVEKLLLY